MSGPPPVVSRGILFQHSRLRWASLGLAVVEIRGLLSAAFLLPASTHAQNQTDSDLLSDLARRVDISVFPPKGCLGLLAWTVLGPVQA